MATKRTSKSEKALEASKRTASNLRKKVKELEDKATKKRSSSRRKKGSRVKPNKDFLVNGAMAIVGAVGASYIANRVPVQDERLKAALPILVGAGVSLVPALSKNKYSSAISAGAITAGGLSLVKKLAPQVPLMAGEEDYFYMGESFDMLGYDEDLMGESFEDLMGEPVDVMAADWQLPY